MNGISLTDLKYVASPTAKTWQGPRI